MAKQLVVSLVGRICLVTKGADAWAVFLNIEDYPKRRLREHKPLMTVPLSMVLSQTAADDALLTNATFVNPTGARTSQVDSTGVWSIAGYDMSFRGVGEGSGRRRIKELADLNAIVASVDPSATFEPGILGPKPSRFGVLSRLKLPRGAKITAVVEDPTLKTFRPGGYTQVLATYVKCEIPFANDLVGPSLSLRAFKGVRRASYKFNGQKYNKITLTLTNLCNCVRPTYKPLATDVLDDHEFHVYYQLLKTPLKGKPPVPFAAVKLGGVHFLCFNGARLYF